MANPQRPAPVERCLIQSPIGEMWVWSWADCRLVVVLLVASGAMFVGFKRDIPASWPRQAWPVDFHD